MDKSADIYIYFDKEVYERFLADHQENIKKFTVEKKEIIDRANVFYVEFKKNIECYTKSDICKLEKLFHIYNI